VAVALKEAGLSRVTVSLDSLDPRVFRAMSGRDASPDAVLAGIDAAVAAGLSPIKVNCVVQRGVNDHTLVDLARHFRGTGHILRFIEFMDVGTRNAWDMAQVVFAREILERIGSQFPLRAEEPNYPGEVARRYHYTDGAGEIGLIASVSAPFCGSCTRGRLSTKGGFVTCLFASEGLDLRTPLRGNATDEDLRALIAARWASRDDRYSEERRPEGTPTRGRIEMFQLGG
jgi:cyclic pyranopterin phosphate synthase